MLIRSNFTAGIILLVLVFTTTALSAQTIFVDGEASGPIHDGTSWCHAFTQLYEALESATTGAMVKVADGIYLPDVTGLIDPREATFAIPSGVTIAGGYAGCGAANPDARNPWTYITELSGDLAGDDPTGGLADNVYHVATAAAMEAVTTLSGLVIRGGNSEGERLGGGLLAQSGRLVLSICTLTENRAWRGGGVYIEGGELHLFQCRFTGNLTTGEGGAIFDATSNLEAHNCLFALNQAANDGGAIFSDLCAVDLFNCSFGGNVSESRGGAIYEYVGVEALAGNCIFWGNSDLNGNDENSQIFLNPSNTLSIDYSCVQGWTGGFGGEGNIGADPLLNDLTTGDMHLQPGSPCIDHGTNTLVGSQLDLDGNPRIMNGIVDMGCYEFQGPTGLPDFWTGEEAPRILSILNLPGSPGPSVRFLPPRYGEWSLRIYDVRGRYLKQLSRGTGASGLEEIAWDGLDELGRQVPSGVYLFVLEGRDRFLDTSKVTFVR